MLRPLRSQAVAKNYYYSRLYYTIVDYTMTIVTEIL